MGRRKMGRRKAMDLAEARRWTWAMRRKVR
jgi:hypothetical protein